MQIQIRIIEKAARELRYTLGVVYEPNREDTQGDFAKAEDIRASAWKFMERLQALAKTGTLLVKSAIEAGDDGLSIDITEAADAVAKGAGLDDEHLQLGDDADLGVIVESYIAPADFELGEESVKKGTWLLGVKWSEDMWSKIKKGERTGLSLYGRAKRVEVS